MTDEPKGIVLNDEPCPFCGGTRYELISVHVDVGELKYGPFCPQCRITHETRMTGGPRKMKEFLLVRAKKIIDSQLAVWEVE